MAAVVTGAGGARGAHQGFVGNRVTHLISVDPHRNKITVSCSTPATRGRTLHRQLHGQLFAIKHQATTLSSTVTQVPRLEAARARAASSP